MTTHDAPLPRPFGTMLEPVYRRILESRNRAFDAGQGVIDIGVPVISVGNINVGGSGKTPIVMRLTEWLLASGRRPAIAMRGYKSRPGVRSDEEAQYRDRFPDVPVVAQPDRAAGLAPLVERRQIDCVILDDGFQHRRLHRALDIVLVDVTRDPFADRCLPAGWLREPPEALRRAHIVALTHTEGASDSTIDALCAQIERVRGEPPEVWSRHEWAELCSEQGVAPVESLRGQRVIAATAIGNPRAFLDSLREAEAIIGAEVRRRDHHRWTVRDARELRRLAAEHGSAYEPALVVTTDKDWVKLRMLPPTALPGRIVRPRLELAFVRGEGRLREAVEAATDPGTPPGTLSGER